MIVVKIEMWPGGYEDAKYPLGTLVIVNDGTSENPKRGNYDVWRLSAGQAIRSFRTRPSRGRVDNYPRASYSIFELVKRALESVL